MVKGQVYMSNGHKSPTYPDIRIWEEIAVVESKIGFENVEFVGSCIRPMGLVIKAQDDWLWHYAGRSSQDAIAIAPFLVFIFVNIKKLSLLT